MQLQLYDAFVNAEAIALYYFYLIHKTDYPKDLISNDLRDYSFFSMPARFLFQGNASLELSKKPSSVILFRY